MVTDKRLSLIFAKIIELNSNELSYSHLGEVLYPYLGDLEDILDELIAKRLANVIESKPS